jgi:hypothetical protein
MISFDVSWGPFIIVFGIAALLIIAIVAAIIILIVFLVKGDMRKGQQKIDVVPEPSFGSSKPEDKK